jgi:hypothetical protein
LEAQKGLIDIADKELQRLQKLGSAKVVSQAEIDGAQQNLASAKAKLAGVEAEMPYLLGKQPQAASGRGQREINWNNAFNAAQVYPNIDFPYPMVDIAGTLYRPFTLEAAHSWPDFNTQLYSRWASVIAQPPVPASMADKIRKALDQSISVNIQGKALPEILEEFHKAAGITFQLAQPVGQPDFSQLKLSLVLGEVPLGAALQAMEDTVPQLRFTPRDYGVLVSWESRLPPGAVRLHDFWKGDKEKPKPSAESARSEGSRKNPPPNPVRGTVREVDKEEPSLLKLSIGSDAGVAAGHTLEVFRLDPKPEYLGTVRITEVKPHQAVAKVERTLQGTSIRQGDLVGSEMPKR